MAAIGRKSKYKSHIEPFFDDIVSWRQQGVSEIDIAEKLGVAYSTLKEYKNKYSAFKAVLDTSKKKLVNNLKRSLFKEALGFEYEETQTNIEESYLGTKNKIQKTKKYARSQANLLIFALCNLAPEEFKRVDKEELKEFEDRIAEDRKQAQSYTDEAIRRAYNSLYEDVDRKIKKEKAAADDGSS